MKSRLPQGYGSSRGDMLKQVQKAQQDMEDMQEILKQRIYTARAGGGVVEAKVRGDNTVVSINIAPEVVDPEDTEMLGDLVAAAINEALKKVSEDSSKELDKISSGGLAGLDLSSLGFG